MLLLLLLLLLFLFLLLSFMSLLMPIANVTTLTSTLSSTPAVVGFAIFVVATAQIKHHH